MFLTDIKENNKHERGWLQLKSTYDWFQIIFEAELNKTFSKNILHLFWQNQKQDFEYIFAATIELLQMKKMFLLVACINTQEILNCGQMSNFHYWNLWTEDTWQTKCDVIECTLIISEWILFLVRTKSITASASWGCVLIFSTQKVNIMHENEEG